MPKGMESGPQKEFKQNVEDAGGRYFSAYSSDGEPNRASQK
jgi:hypothetical protein